MKLNPQITDECRSLLLLLLSFPARWNVMPRARNARGLNIAYDNTGTEFIGFQGKALSKRNPLPLGRDIEKIMGDFWIIGRLSFWLQPSGYDQPLFREAWDGLPSAPIPSDEGSL